MVKGHVGMLVKILCLQGVCCAGRCSVSGAVYACVWYASPKVLSIQGWAIAINDVLCAVSSPYMPLTSAITSQQSS